MKKVITLFLINFICFSFSFAQINLDIRGDGYISGDVGIGTNTPDKQLHLFGDGSIKLEQIGGAANHWGELNITPGGKFRLYYNDGNGGSGIDIIPGGNVGIGTTSPGSKLEVSGGTQNHTLGDSYIANIHGYQQSGLYVQATFNQGGEIARFSQIGVGFVDDPKMVIKNGGNVGIGTTNPFQALHVDGKIQIGSAEILSDEGFTTMGINSTFIPVNDNVDDLGSSSNRWDEVWATDGTINTSDARDKTNVQNLNYGLQEVLNLRPVRYQWNNDSSGNEKLGLIAQEILTVLPEVVKTHDQVRLDEENPENTQTVELARMGVFYSDIIPVLVKAIQEQNQLISALQNQVQQLESSK